jgi:hypothetical protein
MPLQVQQFSAPSFNAPARGRKLNLAPMFAMLAQARAEKKRNERRETEREEDKTFALASEDRGYKRRTLERAEDKQQREYEYQRSRRDNRSDRGEAVTESRRAYKQRRSDESLARSRSRTANERFTEKRDDAARKERIDAAETQLQNQITMVDRKMSSALDLSERTLGAEDMAREEMMLALGDRSRSPAQKFEGPLQSLHPAYRGMDEEQIIKQLRAARPGVEDSVIKSHAKRLTENGNVTYLDAGRMAVLRDRVLDGAKDKFGADAAQNAAAEIDAEFAKTFGQWKPLQQATEHAIGVIDGAFQKNVPTTSRSETGAPGAFGFGTTKTSIDQNQYKDANNAIRDKQASAWAPFRKAEMLALGFNLNGKEHLFKTEGSKGAAFMGRFNKDTGRIEVKSTDATTGSKWYDELEAMGNKNAKTQAQFLGNRSNGNDFSDPKRSEEIGNYVLEQWRTAPKPKDGNTPAAAPLKQVEAPGATNNPLDVSPKFIDWMNSDNWLDDDK